MIRYQPWIGDEMSVKLKMTVVLLMHVCMCNNTAH